MSRQTPAQRYLATAQDTPEAAARRLLEVYRLAIQAAIDHKPEGIRYCLELLRSNLRPDPNPELALSLLALYQDCESAALAGDFANAAEILESIRGYWLARMRLDQVITEPAFQPPPEST